MSISEARKWEKFRKLGRTHFVIRYGVLGWGIPTGILFAVISGCIDGWDNFLPQLIKGLISFPLVGILCGRIWWRQLEHKHAPVGAAAHSHSHQPEA